MERKIENKLKTLIDKSGNSDVDLVVNIETKAIAYSILCSSYARGDITEDELDRAVRKLDSLLEKDRRRQKERNQVVEFDSRSQNNPRRSSRRKWI
ncbi:hypothetical protein [Ornithinibacillus scapharcae]|uniref:hypothetical protein n=1 Tax=Ornithinibacillus scapharcae TaxID=1147159 RepID=UPI000225BC2E|nr:hypothetical protein [Ornithinibacillus scapharcae]